MCDKSIESLDDATDLFTIKTSHYVIAGMSLVAALSWNDAIKSAINRHFPTPSDSTSASILYSVIITLVLILLVYCLPNTKSELPHETQHRLNLTELAIQKAQIQKQLTEQEKRIISMQQQLRVQLTSSRL